MMEWKGKNLKTWGDIGKAIDKIISIEPIEEARKEAQKFMRIYRKENKYADKNIGYFSGYYSRETMRKIQDLFCVSHPIFGKSIPTPKEALEAGMRMVRSTNDN